jgi:hypothetical protein
VSADLIDLGAHALGYAQRGLEVLAVEPGGKKPLTQRGKDSATADASFVAAWWAQQPTANIGLRPGEDVVVLDVDPRAGGATALVALLADHGRELVPTLAADTGGGGLHIWYRCPGAYRGQLCRGVDIKGHSGYVVAPPSMHSSGRRYRWANETPIATAPRWLRELIRRPPAGRASARLSAAAGDRAAAGLARVVAEAGPGNRNAALFWAACRVAEVGGPACVLEELREAARSTGLDDREITRTLRSAFRRREVAA